MTSRKCYSDRPCTLFYDTTIVPVEGDYILSMSRKTGEPTGKAYRITSVRRVKSDVHPNRYSLNCLRCHLSEIPEEARKLTLFWYPRSKR